MIEIAVPMVVSQACYTIMTFTDRMFLSRLSPDLMNAAMGGGLTIFAMMTFFLGLTGYTTALAAQYYGSGNKKNCALATSQAVLIAFIAYPVILLCRPLAHGLFDIIGVVPGQLEPQKLYFNILIYAVIITLLRNCFSSFFSGIGRTKIVMISALTAMIVNICVNYVLIFGKFGMPALGIRGAAYGTITGSVCGLLVLVCSYFNRKLFRDYHIGISMKFDRSVMLKLLRFGYPAGLEMFLNLQAFNCLIMIFHSMGATAATATTIVFNWDMVSFVPLLGVEIGVTSLVGRYMGARDSETAHKAAMSGLKLGMVYSCVILVLFIGCPALLVDVFHPSVPGSVFYQARSIAVTMIRMASFYVLVEAMIVVFIGALRGAGDTFWAMLISISLHWVLVPVLFVLMKLFGVSIQTGWTVLVCIFFVFALPLYLRYKSGHWKKIKVMAPFPETIPAILHEEFHEPSDL